MKTLVVLSALAAVALAAPALLGEGSENFKQTITNFPEISTREKKSPQDLSQQATPEAHANEPTTSQISELGVSGRSLGLKKPIIIKKKLGLHHVYRDSDEEQAESGETCGKQVKVKLCDGKSEDIVRSTTIEDMNNHMTEDDMKNSIMLAKEAVENLQRDLKIVERKPGMKTNKHGKSESDAELHQDIEVAREALEHIHKNFGNLESMSLHTTLKDADTVQDAHFQMAKTEEQRLAQWKEAMDTIQKNVEIAKNIEDSFKSTSEETGVLFSDDMMTNNAKHDSHKISDAKMRATEDVKTKDKNKINSESCTTDHAGEKSNAHDKIKGKLIEDDMASAASTISEQKVGDFLDTESTRHASELPDTRIDKTNTLEKNLESSLKGKKADMETLTLGDLKKDSLVSDSMKIMDENKERKIEELPEHKDKKLSLTGSTDSIASASTNKMKSVESEDMLLDQQRNVAANNHDHQLKKSLISDEHLQKMENTGNKNFEMKSAQETQNILNKKEDKMQEKHMHTELPKEVDPTMFVKYAEEKQVQPAHKEDLDHLKEPKQATSEDLKQQPGMVTATNFAEHKQFQQQNPSSLPSEMREANDQHIHQHRKGDPSHTRWAEDDSFQSQMEFMKSADGIHSQSTDHHQTMQQPNHHHHVHHSTHAMNGHHFDTPGGHGQFHSRFADFTPQGKSADMDMQSYYMSMRDNSNLGPDTHRFRWRPMHESSARTTYGAPAAPAATSPQSGGVVGMFPTGNVGGCGIPLLLSCNPTVVSGSLAKAPPAPYSAPAYRTEDEFNLHAKRDVKKSHENLPHPLHRTPENVNLKSSTVLVAKQ